MGAQQRAQREKTKAAVASVVARPIATSVLSADISAAANTTESHGSDDERRQLLYARRPAQPCCTCLAPACAAAQQTDQNRPGRQRLQHRRLWTGEEEYDDAPVVRAGTDDRQHRQWSGQRAGSAASNAPRQASSGQRRERAMLRRRTRAPWPARERESWYEAVQNRYIAAGGADQDSRHADAVASERSGDTRRARCCEAAAAARSKARPSVVRSAGDTAPASTECAHGPTEARNQHVCRADHIPVNARADPGAAVTAQNWRFGEARRAPQSRSASRRCRSGSRTSACAKFGRIRTVRQRQP